MSRSTPGSSPGSAPPGVVHGPDGRPLAGAAVILSTKSLRAQLYNGKFHEGALPPGRHRGRRPVHFPGPDRAVPRVRRPRERLRRGGRGPLAGPSPLTLRPWGRIEGTVKIGDRPAAGVQVRLSETDNRWDPNEAMPITQAQQLKTDARGRYAFEHVIPARLSVSRIFTLERSSFHVGTGSVRTVTAKPGGTTFVDLGGTGRPVVGRFAMPAGIKAAAIFPYLDQTLERIRPEPPYPRISAQGARGVAGRVAGDRRGRGLFQHAARLRYERPPRRPTSGSRTSPPASTGSTPRCTSPATACPGPSGRAREHRHGDHRPRDPRRPLRRAAGPRHDRAPAVQGPGKELSGPVLDGSHVCSSNARWTGGPWLTCVRPTATLMMASGLYRPRGEGNHE